MLWVVTPKMLFSNPPLWDEDNQNSRRNTPDGKASILSSYFLSILAEFGNLQIFAVFQCSFSFLNLSFNPHTGQTQCLRIRGNNLNPESFTLFRYLMPSSFRRKLNRTYFKEQNLYVLPKICTKPLLPMPLVIDNVIDYRQVFIFVKVTHSAVYNVTEG